MSVNHVKFDYHDNNFKEKCGREVETAMRLVLFVFHISLVHIERLTTVSWIICLSSFYYCAVLFFGSCVLYFHPFFYAQSIVHSIVSCVCRAVLLYGIVYTCIRKLKTLFNVCVVLFRAYHTVVVLQF